MSSKRVTREDVARVAKTSTAVVSYVINNGPRPVSARTRERVLEAISLTGYVPNRAAQALAQGYSKTVALLVPDITNRFLALLARRVEHELFSHGYTLLLGDSSDDRERETTLVSAFIGQQVSGILWYGVDQPVPLDLFEGSGTDVIILNASTEQQREGINGNVFSLVIDEREEARIATEHLIEHGRTKIGIIAGPASRLNARDRTRGWLSAITAAGLKPGPKAHADFTEDGGKAAAEILFAEGCDGIIASNERQAVGVLAAAANSGITIPDQVALAAINGTDLAQFLSPSLTTVDQDIDLIANLSIQALRGTDQYQPGRHQIPVRLVIRTSCGCERAN